LCLQVREHARRELNRAKLLGRGRTALRQQREQVRLCARVHEALGLAAVAYETRGERDRQRRDAQWHSTRSASRRHTASQRLIFLPAFFFSFCFF
jgi:hypothetical protein